VNKQPDKTWPVNPVPWPIGRNPVGAEKDVIYGLMQDNLIALLDHYGIDGGFDDPSNGWKLAICLAGETIPGFAPEPPPPPPKPAHRPTELRAGARDLVLCLVLAHAKLRGVPIGTAANKLAERWKEEGKSNASGSTLKRRFYRIIRMDHIPAGILEAARVLDGGNK